MTIEIVRWLNVAEEKADYIEGGNIPAKELAKRFAEAALTIESLVKALEPFAKIASSEITGGDPFQYYWVVIGAPGRVSFTDEDLRRARAEITKLRGGAPESPERSG